MSRAVRKPDKFSRSAFIPCWEATKGVSLHAGEPVVTAETDVGRAARERG